MPLSGEDVASGGCDGGGDTGGAVAEDDRAQYAELTRRAGRLLYSRVGGDVTLSPLLTRRPHVSTVRVDGGGPSGGGGGSSGGGSGSAVDGGSGGGSSVSEVATRQRWSLVEGEPMSLTETLPASCRSLPRSLTNSSCRQQLGAVTTRWVQHIPACFTAHITYFINLYSQDIVHF